MGKRRNPFADWMTDNTRQDGPEQGLPLPGQPEPPPAAPPPPRSVLDQLGLPEPEKKGRGRAWEKANPTRTYRGVDAALKPRLNELAVCETLRVNDVIRAFFEFGLEEYQAGRLVLKAAPRGRYMTLYPEQEQQHTAWKRGAKRQPNRRQSNRSKTAKQTGWLATRNLPASIHNDILALAQHLHVPNGEVVTALLTHAIGAYEREEFHLCPAD